METTVSTSDRKAWLSPAALAGPARPGFTFWLLSSLLGLLVFSPFGAPLLGREPDLSLRMMLHEAFARHLQYGRDVVFTYGPWSILQAGYDGRTWTATVAVSLALGLVFGWTATSMARTLSIATGPALLATATTAALFLSGGQDARYFGLLVLMLLWNLVEPGPRLWLARAPLVVAVAVIALIKGSYLVTACVVIGAMALRFRSGTTRLLLLFTASLLLAWVASGQSPSGFPQFCVGLFRIMSGYAAAAGTPGSGVLALSVATLASGGILLYAILVERRRAGTAGLAGLACVLFLMLKSTFVRYDFSHELLATNLVIVIIIVLIGGTIRDCPPRVVRPVAVSIVTLEVLMLAANGGFLIDKGRAAMLDWRVAAERAHYLRDAGRLSEAGALPMLSGEVDAYQWGNAALLARGEHYSPRPVFQSYMAWTPELAAMNLTHLRAHPPDWIVMHVETIDGRFEPLDDAPSWLEILSRYDLRGGSTDRLILARRAVPRPWHLEQVARLEALQGGMVLVPESSAPLWCQVELRPSFRGRLRNAALRPSRVTMEYTTDDTTRSAFVVPAMMRGGFLLSPAVRTTAAFGVLMTSEIVPPRSRVRTIRFIPEIEGDFEPPVTIRFARIMAVARPRPSEK